MKEETENWRLPVGEEQSSTETAYAKQKGPFPGHHTPRRTLSSSALQRHLSLFLLFLSLSQEMGLQDSPTKAHFKSRGLIQPIITEEKYEMRCNQSQQQQQKQQKQRNQLLCKLGVWMKREWWRDKERLTCFSFFFVWPLFQFSLFLSLAERRSGEDPPTAPCGWSKLPTALQLTLP